METFFRDLRYSVRMLIKSPGFTAVAVISIALGIGANTAVFSVINAVLLRNLPYQDPNRILILWNNFLADDQAKLGRPEVLRLESRTLRLRPDPQPS